jgi:hypothetical protein
VQGALEGVKALPQYHTVNYDLNLKFADGKTVRVNNVDVNDDSSGGLRSRPRCRSWQRRRIRFSAFP